jgi:hypothetical protein
MELSYSELQDMLNRAAIGGAKQVLKEIGLMKSTYTRAEIERLYGRAIYRRSLMYVKWTKKGDFKTSPVICQRADFDSWIQKHDAELGINKRKEV